MTSYLKISLGDQEEATHSPGGQETVGLVGTPAVCGLTIPKEATDDPRHLRKIKVLSGQQQTAI